MILEQSEANLVDGRPPLVEVHLEDAIEEFLFQSGTEQSHEPSNSEEMDRDVEFVKLCIYLGNVDLHQLTEDIGLVLDSFGVDEVLH